MAKFSSWNIWTLQEDSSTFSDLDLVVDLFSAISFLGFPGKEDLDLVLDPVLVVLDLGFGLNLDLLDQFFLTIDFAVFGNLSPGNLGILTLQEFWTLLNLDQFFSIIDFLGSLGKEVPISCVFDLLGIHESL